MSSQNAVQSTKLKEARQSGNLHLLLRILGFYAVVVFALSGTGGELFEHLHLLIDTSNGMLSLLLAMFLMAEQTGISPNLRKYLVISFAFTAATEILHATVGIEWSGWMAWATAYSNTIRPATWPPSAYLLPLALAWIHYLERRQIALRPGLFILGMSLLTLTLFVLAFNLPKYVDTGILGIHRPTQFPLLFLLLGVTIAYWRQRQKHPLFEGIALMCVLLFLSDLCMLFSTSPHEKFTMMAHAGKFFAYILLHTLLMRAAAEDVRARACAEQELAEQQRHLEELVQQRTEALLATEARASHIIQASADGLFGTDQQGRITFMNPAGCKILGYSEEQLIGQHAHPLLHHSKADGSPYPSEACPSLHALHDGQDVRVDNEVYWHADGHSIPVMYAMHPMREDGKITGGVISFVDITLQHAAAEARERALIAAENLARLRSEFLSNMSHEIRTPLNGVLGFARIGARNHENSEKALDAFSKIQEAGSRLLRIVNEVLDFSKIEAGKLHIEHLDFPLHDLLHQSADLVREQAHAKHLELQLLIAPNLPASCISDPQRLGQILLNLLSNSVKFTEAGKVTLHAERQGNELRFQVSDTGIGMTPAQLGELFSPFHQADASTSRRYGGTGLGLAISKRLLELLGGDIEVTSQVGVGSTFTFHVPYVAS